MNERKILNRENLQEFLKKINFDLCLIWNKKLLQSFEWIINEENKTTGIQVFDNSVSVGDEFNYIVYFEFNKAYVERFCKNGIAITSEDNSAKIILVNQKYF